MQIRTGWTRAAMAATLVAASAAAASAQTTAYVEVSEIEALEMKAQEHMQDLGEWGRAATLFRRAAELRPSSDPAGVADLMQAARLSYYHGDKGDALRDFEAAGQRALALGDVIVAANAFVDAAWVAEANGRSARALDLVGRARLLANSPLLPDEIRDDLKNRWVETETAAVSTTSSGATQ